MPLESFCMIKNARADVDGVFAATNSNGKLCGFDAIGGFSENSGACRDGDGLKKTGSGYKRGCSVCKIPMAKGGLEEGFAFGLCTLRAHSC